MKINYISHPESFIKALEHMAKELHDPHLLAAFCCSKANDLRLKADILDELATAYSQKNPISVHKIKLKLLGKEVTPTESKKVVWF